MALPKNVDKTRKFNHTVYTILDEIVHPQSGNKSKTIYLQKLRDSNGDIEYRLGWYSLQPNGSWKWVNGTMMAPKKDFNEIIKKAQEKPGFLE